MAVTIDDLQVDVQDQPAPIEPSSGQTPQPRIDLRSALCLEREREMRLKAD